MCGCTAAAAYIKAIEEGADMIECDMVLTKDLQILCRHEPLLSGTTNADDYYVTSGRNPSLNKTYIIDGAPFTGKTAACMNVLV